MNLRLLLIFLAATLLTPSVFGQKKPNFSGRWWGKATVDYGFGSHDDFEYELQLEDKNGIITGISTTTLIIRGQRYTAKAEIVGKGNKTLLICRETHNITEDRLPESSWVPFEKMELIFRIDNDTPTLEGLYNCGKSPEGRNQGNGRLLLRKKPPQA